VTAEDARQFAILKKKAEYGVTAKELTWLLRLIEKLDRQLLLSVNMVPRATKAGIALYRKQSEAPAERAARPKRATGEGAPKRVG
jgi:hypothetical protein